MPDTTARSASVDALFDAAYADLRALAHARLQRGGRDALLDTTALVHESYLRLAQRGDVRFPDRARFLAYASRVMRSIIVDLARAAAAERRGGGGEHVTFTAQLADRAAADADEILRVHEALERLERLDARMARVVEMRWFAGLTIDEIAAALGVTGRTVRRDWEQARLVLAEALR